MTVAIFPSSSEIQAIAAPLVADAVVQLGSLADIHAIVSAKQKDNSYKKVPLISGHDVPIMLRMITSEQAEEIFGKESKVEMRGSMTRSVEVETGNVVEVRSGAFVGYWLEVVKLIERPRSDSYVLGLVTTKPLP